MPGYLLHNKEERTLGFLPEGPMLVHVQAPGLPFFIPKDYTNLPKLIGRATVALTIEKADGSNAFIDRKNGGLTKRLVAELVLDGYSAPLSAGNFAANIQVTA